MKSVISRWPEEERGRGEAEDPDLFDRISLDGTSVNLDGTRASLDGSRVSLDGSTGTQTDFDGQLEVTWMLDYYPEKTFIIHKIILTEEHHQY